MSCGHIASLSLHGMRSWHRELDDAVMLGDYPRIPAEELTDSMGQDMGQSVLASTAGRGYWSCWLVGATRRRICVGLVSFPDECGCVHAPSGALDSVGVL